jgi:hypothetical protein
MSERSIILRPEEVRAILDGRKTQLRRVVKDTRWIPADWSDWSSVAKNAVIRGRCPFGNPGDRLWGKETWATTLSLDHLPATRLASGAPVQYRNCESNVPGYPRLLPPVVRWRSAVHMPRWASRITLEVHEVRVQRLQDISSADLLAEGHDGEDMPDTGDPWDDFHERYQRPFMNAWNKANPKHPYDSNPFVWVVTFKRVEDDR